MAAKRAKAALWAVIGTVLALALVAGGIALWSEYTNTPLPIDDRCTATAGGRTTTIDPEQARNAAIIAGMSIRRGLAPRAASIALATAYQESGIRNLDYGHADSIGLFQQRPSTGWGTVEQIMDPWYSTREFYRAMERIDDWETRDLNDVAQAVQRSAFPEAYRDHVPDARTLASSLTGQTPASFSCVVASPGAADPDGLRDFLVKTLGGDAIDVRAGDGRVRVSAANSRYAWAAAHLAVANTDAYGLATVTVGPYAWSHARSGPAEWVGEGPTDTATEVEFTFVAPR